MAKNVKINNVNTITLNELSELFEKANSIESREEVKGFVIHEIRTDKGTCLVLPTPNDQLFFQIMN